MPTVIDSLVVTLGLDATKYQRAQVETRATLKQTGDEATRVAKEMQARGQQAAEFFGSIKREALGLITVLLGGKGAFEFTRDAVTSMAALGREARNIGLSVPQLAAFSNMIERGGGNADAATASFRGLTDAMERFKVLGQADPIFRGALGQIGAFQGDDPLTVYKKFAAYAQAHIKDVPLVNLIGRSLGLDPGTINATVQMLTKGGLPEVMKELQRSLELGTPTEAMTKRAQELQASWVALSQAATNLGNHIVDDLEPHLKSVLDYMTDIIVKQPDVAKAFVGVAAGIGGMLTVRSAASILGLKTLVGLLDSLLVLAARISVFSAPLLLKGDSGPDSAPADPKKPGFLQQGGGLEKWIRGTGIFRGISRWLSGSTDSSDASAPRGIRNNNPGNLEFAGQEGATREPGSGRFARFETMDQGVTALGKQLQLYASRGKNTIRSIIETYAPSGENNTEAYIKHMSETMGVTADQPLDLSNPMILSMMQRGIISMENGPRYSSLIPPAGVDQAIRLGAGAKGGQSTNTTNTVHVGTIVVHTQATDATGIARGIGRAIRTDFLVTQANTGLA